MDTKARARLIHLLISKSMAEALLITAVAVGFYFATTNPNLRGVLDNADESQITGWAVDEANPSARVEVQLFVDDVYAGNATSNQFRPDVHSAGRVNDDWHGFLFHTPKLAPGQHEARVYALHSNGGGTRRTLQLIGKPYSFHVD
jgi:hypothetical protein